ncbi:hypothetical protein CANINC_004751 [Pichia inconspicua]|uniref:Uncharacterized protein n=1 Tax=Pichia inconspicua TaxID=52247 RepID=A0A4T0WV76_9ASCO|nr:hypothetical protein CANINC_004751 [[Candida] inconspicua]
MDDIPPLSPPQDETSTTTPQSIGDYSPVEHMVSHREHFTTVTPNIMQTTNPIPATTTPTTEEITTATANLGRDDTIANLLDGSSPSPSQSNKSFNSIATFDDDDDDDIENTNLTFNDSQIDDSDLFEHYNGSISDLATELDTNVVSPTITSALPSPTSPTPLIKTRKQELPMKTSSRTITPLCQNQEEKLSTTTLSNRIASLESDLATTETKHYKLEREIVCVDDLLNKITDRHSVEYKKLNYARAKLEERLLTAKKDRYTIGIKLNKLRKKLYGDNGGDMTEYFARKVSI